ncbi:MAG: pyridoxamine 5'-phosphate oxidase family protein [Xanthomonadales bacterium]|nr:pyridoxamine 5'-phosphate oxidase family protein [Xanthomonadales bacterium]
MSDKSAQERLDELIEKFDTAMLVTNSLQGGLRARPMAIAGHSEGALLHFATRSDNQKLEEVLADSSVAVTMQDGARYLSITGRARLDTSLDTARELWSPGMKLWFPDGPADPAMTLIVVEPECAEYWDREGIHQLEFLWEAGKALIRGERPDNSALGGHAKVAPD